MMESTTTRDTLGRVFKSQESQPLHDSKLAGDRESIRTGVLRRMDGRKGAELLADRSFGKHGDATPAPLDSRRVHHGVALKVAEKILPLHELNPQTRSDLKALFEKPAVVRAFVTNPDATIRDITAAMPHLREVLEKNKPFSMRDTDVEVNTQSPMYKIIKKEVELGIPSYQSALRHNLDGLLTSVVGTRLGGAAGMETASYKLLRAYAEQGPTTVKGYHAAQRLHDLSESDRANYDLATVRSVARSNNGQPTPSLPIYAPASHTIPVPPLVQVAPPTYRVPSPPIMADQKGSPVPSSPPPPQFKAAEIRRELPVTPVSQPPQLASAQAPSNAPKVDTPQPRLPSIQESQVVSPAPPVMTQTMARLVGVVNNSTLDRQIGSPRDNPTLEFSDRDHDKLKAMLTDPLVKRELLNYSDSQLRAGFEAVRPDRIKYLEEWLAMNHRNAVKHPRFAESMAGITPSDTNRIGQVVGIARAVAQERAAQ